MVLLSSVICLLCELIVVKWYEIRVLLLVHMESDPVVFKSVVTFDLWLTFQALIIIPVLFI